MTGPTNSHVARLVLPGNRRHVTVTNPAGGPLAIANTTNIQEHKITTTLFGQRQNMIHKFFYLFKNGPFRSMNIRGPRVDRLGGHERRVGNSPLEPRVASYPGFLHQSGARTWVRVRVPSCMGRLTAFFFRMDNAARLPSHIPWQRGLSVAMGQKSSIINHTHNTSSTTRPDIFPDA